MEAVNPYSDIFCRSQFEDNLRYPAHAIDGYIIKYRFYHTVVALCNRVFSRVLFSAKVMTLTCAIFGSYFVLSHAETASIPVMLFFTILSLQSVSFFVISCQQLFSVPNRLRSYIRTLNSFLEHQTRNMTMMEAKLLHRRIQYLMVEGISDGGFRKMDSISTLLYLDFYLNRVISLLLM